MSDANTSFWKSTALFLLLALIGVYVLYDWYDGTLQTRLSQKETYIAQTVSWIKAGETRPLQPEDGQDAIRSAILTLETRNKQDKADLAQRLAAATAAQTETAQKLETQLPLMPLHSPLNRKKPCKSAVSWNVKPSLAMKLKCYTEKQRRKPLMCNLNLIRCANPLLPSLPSIKRELLN
ncbi:hypothetical protein [Chromatium okenii]|uniref:hypothetical protein n=1 Tax=Chromatium okenii TaxID=61644 RepID=UPI0011B00407|nr:hypothetical protein [Chromatium okenii]